MHEEPPNTLGIKFRMGADGDADPDRGMLIIKSCAPETLLPYRVNVHASL